MPRRPVGAHGAVPMRAEPPALAGPLLAGGLALALMGAGAALWSAVAAPQHAVVLQGQVVPAGGAWPLQHPRGGNVAAVLVAEGAQVAAGALLARLADPALEAEAAAVALRLLRAEARLARLRAEAAGADTLELPAKRSFSNVSRSAQHHILQQERAAFDAGVARRAAQRHRVAEDAAAALRIAGALARQAEAAGEQAGLIAAELADQERLLGAGLTQAPRVNALRREAARLRGTIAEADAARERALAAAASARQEHDLMHAAEQERLRIDLAEQSALRDELAARLASLEDRLEALELRSPASGIVQRLALTGPGAVLPPAVAAMHILPDDAVPVVAAALPPGLAETTRPGNDAMIVLAPGPGGVARRIPARVIAISPEHGAAPEMGARYHRVEVAPLPDADAASLWPGMPAEVWLNPEGGGHGALAALAGAVARALGGQAGPVP